MNNFRDKVNKNLFVALLVGGVTLSCAVRFLWISQDEVIASIIAIMICLLCLVAYFLSVKRDTAGLHNPDNLYYMGLLFTLSSLVYSLITLFLLNNEIDIAERVHNLIGSFGIALISTFAGILFRILLLQELDSFGQRQGDQREFEQQARLAHQNLNDAAFKLRMELTQTIADMRVFRRSIVQASNETVQEAHKAHTAMIQPSGKSNTRANKDTFNDVRWWRKNRGCYWFCSKTFTRHCGQSEIIGRKYSNTCC